MSMYGIASGKRHLIWGRYLVVNDVSVFRRDMTEKYLDGLLFCFPRLTAIICRGGKTEWPYVVNWQITLCRTPSLAILSSLLESTRRLITDFNQMVQPPTIQLAFSRDFLLTTPGDCIPLPWDKPFAVSMVAQTRLPIHGMERLCQLLVRYSSLCYNPPGSLTLELDPSENHRHSEDQQLAKALRQVSTVTAIRAYVRWIDLLISLVAYSSELFAHCIPAQLPSTSAYHVTSKSLPHKLTSLKDFIAPRGLANTSTRRRYSSTVTANTLNMIRKRT